jgi:hypothetical protein
MSLDRPVVLSIVRQLLEITNLSSETRILFTGSIGKAAQVGSTMEHENRKMIGKNRWPHDEQIEIEVEEDFDASRLLTTEVVGPEHEFVFWDEELGLYLKPVYSTSTFTINFKFRAVDKEKATKWRNMMRTKVAQKREMLLHECNYTYHIPESFLVIAGEIYTLRENALKTGETPADWFTKRLSDRVSRLSNQAGKQPIFSVSERAMRIQGLFQFDGVPEKGSNEDGGASWTISFGYKFNLDKPIEFVAQYPYVVCNQIVNEKFILEPVYTIEGKDRRYSKTTGNLAYFESDQRGLRVHGYEGVGIPPWDDWTPPSTPTSTIRMFTGLCLITDKDKRTLMNLNELGDYALHPKILEFIKNVEYQYIGINFNSIFSLTLYENGIVQSDTILSIDSNLNIVANKDLDITKTYRVRFGLTTNIMLLPKDAILRIANYETIDPYTGDLSSKYPQPVNNGSMPLATIVNNLPWEEPLWTTSVITLAMLIISAINYAIKNNSGKDGIPKNKLTDTDINQINGNLDPYIVRWNNTYTAEELVVVANRKSNLGSNQ